MQLGLYDIVNTPGVAADLAHISTPAKVEGNLPDNDGLSKTLKGADVVVIPAGVPRKPGVSDSRDPPVRASANMWSTRIDDKVIFLNLIEMKDADMIDECRDDLFKVRRVLCFKDFHPSFTLD